MRLTRQRTKLRLLVTTAGAAALAFAAAAAGAGSITINDPPSCSTTCTAATATPYPSTLTVSGISPSTVSSVTVQLTGLSLNNPDDVDMLLVGPNGTTSVMLMSDAGDSQSTSPGISISFSDSGEALPGDGSQNGLSFINGHTYHPGNLANSDCFITSDAGDSFPAPAPQSGYMTALSAFNGQAANGDWKLYIVDDCGGDGGGTLSNWCLTINGTQKCGTATAVSVTAFSARRLAGGVHLSWRTAQEATLAGFNLYRVTGRGAVKVNRPLIAAKRAGEARGSAYAFMDRAAQRGARATYRLQAVNLDGTRAWVRLATTR